MVTPKQRLQGLETWADSVMCAIRKLHGDNQTAQAVLGRIRWIGRTL